MLLGFELVGGEKSMKNTLTKILTKGEIRKSALIELKLRGVNCWPQNNLAVRGRKFIGRLGVSDIIGFHSKTGVFVACEVKTVTDKFSDDQKQFLSEVKKAGGIAMIATQQYNQVILKEWNPLED